MKTLVIYRTFIADGSLIALFPFESSDRYGHHCMSYQHIGQHGGASPDIVRGSCTRPSTEEEIRPLAEELTRIGYDLKRITRFPRNAFQVRRDSVKAIAGEIQ